MCINFQSGKINSLSCWFWVKPPFIKGGNWSFKITQCFFRPLPAHFYSIHLSNSPPNFYLKSDASTICRIPDETGPIKCIWGDSIDGDCGIMYLLHPGLAWQLTVASTFFLETPVGWVSYLTAGRMYFIYLLWFWTYSKSTKLNNNFHHFTFI